MTVHTPVMERLWERRYNDILEATTVYKLDAGQVYIVSGAKRKNSLRCNREGDTAVLSEPCYSDASRAAHELSPIAMPLIELQVPTTSEVKTSGGMHSLEWKRTYDRFYQSKAQDGGIEGTRGSKQEGT